MISASIHAAQEAVKQIEDNMHARDSTDVFDAICTLREALVSMSRAALAAQGEAEPVAWRWRNKMTGNHPKSWCLGHDEPPQHEQYINEPLYTRPTPPADAAGAREHLQTCVDLENAGNDMAREALRWYEEQLCENGRSSDLCGKLEDGDCGGCRAHRALALLSKEERA